MDHRAVIDHHHNNYSQQAGNRHMPKIQRHIRISILQNAVERGIVVKMASSNTSGQGTAHGHSAAQITVDLSATTKDLTKFAPPAGP